MALINCPECGIEVSDKAVACPRCAFPIADNKADGDVRIKLHSGALVDLYVYENATRKILWQGKSGQVASFYLSEPTEIRVGGKLGLLRNFNDFPCIVAIPNKRYEYKVVSSFLNVKCVIDEVDVIDSN